MGPKGVAVDKNGHIITVDNKACCVFIFQSNGKLVTKFGARGTSDRHFAGIVLILCTSTYDHFINDVSYRKTRCTSNNASCLVHLVGPDLQMLFLFDTRMQYE